MSRTWGHLFTRIGSTTRAYFHVSASHVWLVRYWRRVANSDCKVTASLTEAQAKTMAAKLGIELPGQTKQLDLFNLGVTSFPDPKVIAYSAPQQARDLEPAWSAADERQWGEPPSPPLPGL